MPSDPDEPDAATRPAGPPGPTTGISGQEGVEWTTGYGGPDAAWNHAILPRIAGFVPCEHALELGLRGSLWTPRLRPLCRRMTLVDASAARLEACRQRFGTRGMAYITSDGASVPGVPAGSVDFVFSWHSLVHAERTELAGMLRDLGRAMTVGGVGLIHHSNFGEHVDPASGKASLPNDHARAVTMSAAAFREECLASGLCCTYQELVPWGAEHLVDCFSVFTRPPEHVTVGTVVEENDGFWHRLQDAERVSRRYSRPFPEVKPRAGGRRLLGIPLPFGGA